MGRNWTGQALRYILAGLALNALYWLLAVGINRCTAWDAVGASGLAYGLASVAAYLLHRRFTFQSRNPVAPEALRFALATATGMALALALPNVLPTSSELAYAAVCLVVPVVNFLLYRVLVYARRAPAKRASR